MKLSLPKCSTLVFLSLFAPGLFAQEIVPISDSDISLMGIVFAPVQAMNNTAGARFPATVINSPDSVTTLGARYSGVIEKWHQNAGTAVSAGQTLATIRSAEILNVQKDWIAAVTESDNAQFELIKDQALFDQGVISEQRLIRTGNYARQVGFAEKSARAQLEFAGFNQSRLTNLREKGAGLGTYLLVAPVNGLLTQRVVSVGSHFGANTPIAYLNSGERRWVSIHVPGRWATDMAINQIVTAADSGEAMTLRQKDFVIDSSNQTIELFAEFNGETNFTTGQIISVILPPARQGVLIPGRAVVHSGNIATVYVKAQTGVEARELDLLSVGADYLAETGLGAGEMVAIQGSAVLKGIQLGLGSAE